MLNQTWLHLATLGSDQTNRVAPLKFFTSLSLEGQPRWFRRQDARMPLNILKRNLKPNKISVQGSRLGLGFLIRFPLRRSQCRVGVRNRIAPLECKHPHRALPYSSSCYL